MLGFLFYGYYLVVYLELMPISLLFRRSGLTFTVVSNVDRPTGIALDAMGGMNKHFYF